MRIIAIFLLVLVCGCGGGVPTWTCPQYANQYDESNPPDNAVCSYDDNGVLSQ